MLVETYHLLVAMVTSSRSPSENGSVISNESGKPGSGKRSPQNVTAQQKVTKEEARKRNGEKPSLPSTALDLSHIRVHTPVHTGLHTLTHPSVPPSFLLSVCPPKATSQFPTYLLESCLTSVSELFWLLFLRNCAGP